ncbi:MAG: glycosyltransferase family 4 protein [Lentisphaerae bacterium]|nr:glycosyltransferase family 4 protein [Lentisphaerota bacterium]
MADTPRIGYVVSRFPEFSEGFIRYELAEIRKLAGTAWVLPAVAGPGRDSNGDPFVLAPPHCLSAAALSAWRELLRVRPGPVFGAISRAASMLAVAPVEAAKWLALMPRLAWLGRAAARVGVTHLHAHFAALPACAAWTLSRWFGFSYSVTAHAYDLLSPARFLRMKLSGAAFGVAVSEFTRAALLRSVPESSGFRWHLIRNGIPLDVFAPGPGRPARDTPRLLSVGRMVPKKGAPVLLEACSILRREGCPFECRLVGDGPMMGYLRTLSRRLGIADRVAFPGVLTGADLAREYAEADVFVLACVESMHGETDTLPVVLAEAMASGVPVASTRIAAIPELVEPGRTGLLAAPGNAAELAAAIMRLLDDGALRRTLAAGALEKVRRDYDVRRTAAQLYECMVNAGRRP